MQSTEESDFRSQLAENEEFKGVLEKFMSTEDMVKNLSVCVEPFGSCLGEEKPPRGGRRIRGRLHCREGMPSSLAFDG